MGVDFFHCNRILHSVPVAQHSVQRMVGSLRVFWSLSEFRQFSVSKPVSRPPPLTQAVGRFMAQQEKALD
jgi:hypothetical protein